MKYIKRFNEELKSSTYKSAADKIKARGLDDEGMYHHDDYSKRAKALQDTATERLKEEKKAEWAKKVTEFEGKTPATLAVRPSYPSSIAVNGKFYFIVEFLEDMYIDNLEDGYIDNNIPLFISIIPADESTYSKIEESYGIGISHLNKGIIYAYTAGITFSTTAGQIKLEDFYLEPHDVEYCKFVGINSAKVLVNNFFNAVKGNLYNLIEENVLIRAGLSSDYGLSMEDIIEFIKSLRTGSGLDKLFKRNS